METMQTGGSGSDSAYTALRRRILRLELEPGTELDEATLSRRFGVSRTPIREALIRLSSEGLVTLQRGRGARVAPLDLSGLRGFFEGLDVLQRAVTRLAALRRTAGELDTMERHLRSFEKGARSLDSEAVNDANYEFHLAIGKAGHSSYLCDSYRLILAESQRVTYLCFSEYESADRSLPAHLERTMQEHRQMFEAIRVQDADAAERIAGAHVVLFRNRVADTLMAGDAVSGISVPVTS